jgi:hypothetical protein
MAERRRIDEERRMIEMRDNEKRKRAQQRGYANRVCEEEHEREDERWREQKKLKENELAI